MFDEKTKIVPFEEACRRIAEVIAEAAEKRNGVYCSPKDQITPRELQIKMRGEMTPDEAFAASQQDLFHGI